MRRKENADRAERDGERAAARRPGGDRGGERHPAHAPARALGAGDGLALRAQRGHRPAGCLADVQFGTVQTYTNVVKLENICTFLSRMFTCRNRL